MAKKEDVITEAELCYGVKLGKSFFEKKENRILTLLLKGFIVYLLTMGSIGFYLSALKVEYNEFLCHIIIFIVAILCAFLYYRLLIENLGYLMLFVMFGFLVYTFRTYINSGFYALVNMTVDEAAQYFNVDIQRLYTEQIEDRYITVTFVCLFIGIVLDVLLNVYISRRMQYVNSLFTVMALNLIPLYMILEPSTPYVIMLLSGLAMAYVFKSSKHYSPQVNVKRTDYVYVEKGKKKRVDKPISYVYNVKALTQAGIGVFCFVLCVVLAVSAFKPKENFNVGYKGNKYKDLTMAAVSTFLIDGWSGFYRQQNNVGGMMSGRLGEVSTVRLDYETDLLVQFTPYSYDSLYLKSFTGQRYEPYENEWVSMEYLNEEEYVYQTPEANVLMEAYEEDLANTAKGIVNITNVGVGAGNRFSTYYSNEIVDNEERTSIYSLVYYPRLDGNEAVVALADYEEGLAFTEMDLYVPEENKDAIRDLIEEIEWGANKEMYPEILKAYYQENIPYTIRPGKTPRKEDFVNYFLEENRKGYCAHFATTAVLVFRELGLPARYAEGYSISYNQVLNSEAVEGAEYDDYYDGYSELGRTTLVEINVTDADAHAWVEVYISGKGWIPVDVTPAGEEEEVVDFWEMFDDTMGDSEEDAGGNIDGGIVNFKIPDKAIKTVCYILLGIVALAVLAVAMRFGFKGIIYIIKYSRATINDKLIIKYSIYYKKLCKRDKEMSTKLNYKEQMEYLADKFIISKEEKEKIIAILEKAGFSNTAIQNSDYDFVVDWIASHRKYAR